MNPTIAYELLLADDNKTYRMIVKQWLSSAGYKVTDVQDGKEALAAFQDGDFDLCVFDISMPFINGIDLSRQVKLLKPDTPIIIITSSISEKTRQDAITIGVNKLLQKPTKPDQLLEIIALELEC